MSLWAKFMEWWYRTSRPHRWVRYPASWLFHGMVAGAIVVPFAIAGYASHGFCSAVMAYLFREIEQRLTHGPDKWWDRLGDVLGPVVGAGIVWWLA